MDSFVFAAVLFAAACHAAWNAAIKFRLDPLTATALFTAGSGLIALVLLLYTGLPPAAAWPWVVASVIIHLFYFVGLVECYRAGDLGQVYPLARGAAPLMTAGLATFIVGERLSVLGWGGIVLLALGVLLLSLRGGRDLARFNTRAVGFALFTAVTICLYSVVDGIGGRAAGNPHPYTLAMFTGNGIVMALYAAARGGRKVFADMRPYWKAGFAGGALQLLSYGIAIWAMTMAPIALVAALRETSVLFGAGLAVVLLGEPLRATRIVAAVLIVAGLVVIRLQ